MAGRNQQKLEAARSDLAQYNKDVASVPLVLADLSDETALAKMAGSTTTLISTVGPYALYGYPVVKACVDAGTNYCDLTAELHFERRCIDDFHSTAADKGIRIIHGCGFDSIPSETCMLLAADHLKKRHSRDVGEATFVLRDSRGGFSGGTVESIIGLFKQDTGAVKRMFHPYYLVPSLAGRPVKELPDRGIKSFPLWTKASKTWSAPFMMAFANEPIVRRTNSFLQYGDSLHYSERMAQGGLVGAMLISVFYLFVSALLFVAGKVQFVRKLLPMPSQGPSRETMENGYFKVETYATSKEGGGTRPVRVRSSMNDMHRDPGYLSTSRMLLEAALCMSLQQSDLESDEYAGKSRGGVLPPGAALGMVLVNRLKASGYEYDVRTLEENA